MFFNYLKESWQSVWNELPEFLKPSEEQINGKWFQSCFDDILHSFVEDRKFQFDAISAAFVPDISIEVLPAGFLRSQAEAAMRKLCARDETLVRQAMKNAFDVEWHMLPSFVRSISSFDMLKKNFERGHYFEFVIHVSALKAKIFDQTTQEPCGNDQAEVDFLCLGDKDGESVGVSAVKPLVFDNNDIVDVDVLNLENADCLTMPTKGGGACALHAVFGRVNMVEKN